MIKNIYYWFYRRITKLLIKLGWISLYPPSVNVSFTDNVAIPVPDSNDNIILVGVTEGTVSSFPTRVVLNNQEEVEKIYGKPNASNYNELSNLKLKHYSADAIIKWVKENCYHDYPDWMDESTMIIHEETKPHPTFMGIAHVFYLTCTNRKFEEGFNWWRVRIPNSILKDELNAEFEIYD